MSSLNLNKVILCGRLTADPELKQTTSGLPVVSFTLAVNRRFQSRSADANQGGQADFISLVAWRQTAEFISKFFKKGSALCVTGSIQTRKWQDKNGDMRLRSWWMMPCSWTAATNLPQAARRTIRPMRITPRPSPLPRQARRTLRS